MRRKKVDGDKWDEGIVFLLVIGLFFILFPNAMFYVIGAILGVILVIELL